MTVKDLIEKLSEMPQDAPVYAEGEAADKVIFEKSPDGDFGIVRIFKAWNVEFTGSWDVVERVLEKRFGEEFAQASEMAKNLNVDI